MARVDNTGGAGYVIDNGTGAAVRTKLNQIAAAINSLNSGSGDPSIDSAFQPHIDTGTSLLRIRNSGNTGYVNIGNISLDNLGHVVAASPTMTGDVAMNSTGFLKVPVGTDAQQPGQVGAPTAAIGQFRYNSDQNRFEGYKNTGWGELGGGAGATGGGTDQVFLETGQTITTTYSLTAGKNAITVSPTINNNVEVTVPNGATLVIL
mgnify:CR=1 FL=1|tara:strand:+ start:1400 stop:2017 length:618 start_codon:yes stop_codon:yes gene_type:complete